MILNGLHINICGLNVLKFVWVDKKAGTKIIEPPDDCKWAIYKYLLVELFEIYLGG